MDALYVWLDSNWFTLLQSLGIVGGLLFTTATLRRDRKGRRVTDLLTLTAQHRELWSEVHRRPELARVLRAEVDLIGSPITFAEQEFLNVVIVHFCLGWQLARAGSLVTMEAIKVDIRSFFAKPIPQRIWHETKGERDPQFVRFVDSVLAST